jgi:uncharacterized spore protein YtfJ
MVAKKDSLEPAAPTAGTDEPSAAQILQQIVNRELDAGSVFGNAVTHGARTVIPVARISGGGGGGFGSGSGPEGKADDAKPDAETSEGEGGGMGFGQTARPVGFIEMSDDEVRWRPTWDPTTVIIAAAAAWIVTAVFWGLRPKRVYVSSKR